MREIRKFESRGAKTFFYDFFTTSDVPQARVHLGCDTPGSGHNFTVMPQVWDPYFCDIPMGRVEVLCDVPEAAREGGGAGQI